MMNNTNSVGFGCNHCNGAVGKLVGKGANRRQAQQQVVKSVGGSINSTSKYHIKQAGAYLSTLQTKPSVLQTEVAGALRFDA